MIVHNTNNKIRETLSCLRNNHLAFINSNKNPYVKETDHIGINALFGLMYLRGTSWHESSKSGLSIC